MPHPMIVGWNSAPSVPVADSPTHIWSLGYQMTVTVVGIGAST